MAALVYGIILQHSDLHVLSERQDGWLDFLCGLHLRGKGDAVGRADGSAVGRANAICLQGFSVFLLCV